MGYRIRLTEEAKNDFRGMFSYYLTETQDAEYTQNIIRDIQERISFLKMFPFRYPSLIQEDETIRVMYYKRYAIAYEVQERYIIILYVKHTSRS